jgi:hypothetical protein
MNLLAVRFLRDKDPSQPSQPLKEMSPLLRPYLDVVFIRCTSVGLSQKETAINTILLLLAQVAQDIRRSLTQVHQGLPLAWQLFQEAPVHGLDVIGSVSLNQRPPLVRDKNSGLELSVLFHLDAFVPIPKFLEQGESFGP